MIGRGLLGQRGATEDKPRGPELTLHIGSGGAGYRATCAALPASRDRLASAGILLPDDTLLDSLRTSLESRALMRLRTKLQKQDRYTNLLLSWPELQALDEAGGRFLAREFEGFRIRVIYQICEQAALLQARILRGIESGKRRAGLPGNPGRVTLPNLLDYSRLIRSWNTWLPGIEWSVQLEDTRAPERSIGEFLGGLGLDRDFGDHTGKVVPGLDVASARLLGFLETLYREGGKRWNNSRRTELVDLLIRSQWERPLQNGDHFMGVKALERVRDNYREGNQYLVDHYGVSPSLLEDFPLPACDLTPAAQREFAFARFAAIRQQYRDYPLFTWEGREGPGNKLSAHLGQGWRRGARGTWLSQDKQAVILGRLSAQAWIQTWSHIEISLQGDYVDDKPGPTLVELNGEKLGHLDLRREAIRVSRDSLPPQQLLTLRLDTGASTFSLQNIVVAYLPAEASTCEAIQA